MFNEWIGVKSGFRLPDSGLVNTISSRSSSLEGLLWIFYHWFLWHAIPTAFGFVERKETSHLPSLSQEICISEVYTLQQLLPDCWWVSPSHDYASRGDRHLKKIIPIFILTGRQRYTERSIRACQALSEELPGDRHNQLKSTSVFLTLCAWLIVGFLAVVLLPSLLSSYTQNASWSSRMILDWLCAIAPLIVFKNYCLSLL